MNLPENKTRDVKLSSQSAEQPIVQPSSEEIAVQFQSVIDEYRREGYKSMKKPGQPLPANNATLLKEYLLNRVTTENPVYLPLVKAKFGAMSEVMPTEKTKRGGPMDGTLSISGHISGSTLWLIDGDKNRLQTMSRLLVEKDGKELLVDVYSNPLENGIDKESIDIEGTIPSRNARVLELAKEGYAIKGWVSIDEIYKEKVPQY